MEKKNVKPIIIIISVMYIKNKINEITHETKIIIIKKTGQ